MIKILLDQNFDQRISRGLLVRLPGLDIETTESLGIKRFTDAEVLAKAADLGRVIFTHDERTFPKFAYERIERGERVVGLIVVPANLSIGYAIDELKLIISCRTIDEWEGLIDRLPI